MRYAYFGLAVGKLAGPDLIQGEEGMMSRWIWVCTLSAMALAIGGCKGGQQTTGGTGSFGSDTGSASSVAQPATAHAPQAVPKWPPEDVADSKALAALLDPDNLGTRVAWFDKTYKLTVKRVTSEGGGYHKREYELGQCAADVEDLGGKIIKITAYAGDVCVVDVPFFEGLNSRTPMPALLAAFKDMDIPHFTVHCWNGCGGTAEPDFQLVEEGAQVSNFVNFTLHFRESAGIEKWEDAVLKKLKRDLPPDDDSVMDCTTAYDKLAMDTWGEGNTTMRAVTLSGPGGYVDGLPEGCPARE